MSIHTHGEQFSEDSGKKPYHRPSLSRLGEVLELTQSLSGSGGDGGPFDANIKAGS